MIPDIYKHVFLAGDYSGMKQGLFPPESSGSLLWGQGFTQGEEGEWWGRKEEPDLRLPGTTWLVDLAADLFLPFTR